MPVAWFVENRILYVFNNGDLTVQDFQLLDQQIIRSMREAQRQGSKRVHVIFDATNCDNLPGLKELDRGQLLKYFREPVCGWTVVLGKRENIQLRMLSTFMTALAGARLHNSTNHDEALLFIRQVDIFDRDFPNLKSWLAARFAAVR